MKSAVLARHGGGSVVGFGVRPPLQLPAHGFQAVGLNSAASPPSSPSSPRSGWWRVVATHTAPSGQGWGLTGVAQGGLTFKQLRSLGPWLAPSAAASTAQLALSHPGAGGRLGTACGQAPSGAATAERQPVVAVMGWGCRLRLPLIS